MTLIQSIAFIGGETRGAFLKQSKKIKTKKYLAKGEDELTTNNGFLNNDEKSYIDLRDIFKVLWKWKYIIIGITLICMLISSIVSVCFSNPVYEATVTVAPVSTTPLVNPGDMVYTVTDDNYASFTVSKKMSDYLDNIINMNLVDITQFSAILTSNEVLQNSINELGLGIAPAQLRGQISLKSNEKMPNVSQITVAYTDPERAATIANALVNQTAIYIKEINTQKMDELLQDLEEQQAAAQAELDTAFTSLKEQQANSIQAPDGMQNKIELNKLQKEVDLREKVVDSLSSKIIEVRVIQPFYLAGNKIVVLSAAVPPENPVRSNKKMDVAMAGFFGLAVSVCGVFLVDYLKKE